MKRNIKIKVLLALILMSIGNLMWGAEVNWTPSSIFNENTKMNDEYVTSDGIFTISFRTDGLTRHILSEYNDRDKTLHFNAGNYITISPKVGFVITEVLFNEGSKNQGLDISPIIGAITKPKNKNYEYWTGNATYIDLLNNNQSYVTSIKITYDTTKQNNNTISISSYCYATYYNDSQYFMPNGVDGYTISEAYHKGKITMVKSCPSGSYVPSYTPLLLKGEPGDYPLYSKTGAMPVIIPSNNLLYGSLTDTIVVESGYYYYQLSDGADGLGFYWQEDTEHGITPGTNIYNHAGKCYLRIPSTSSVKSISLSELEDNYILGIDYVTIKPQNQAYNIFGMPVKDDAKGIVIKNGKKYFNR